MKNIHEFIKSLNDEQIKFLADTILSDMERGCITDETVLEFKLRMLEEEKFK